MKLFKLSINKKLFTEHKKFRNLQNVVETFIPQVKKEIICD